MNPSLIVIFGLATLAAFITADEPRAIDFDPWSWLPSANRNRSPSIMDYFFPPSRTPKQSNLDPPADRRPPPTMQTTEIPAPTTLEERTTYAKKISTKTKSTAPATNPTATTVPKIKKSTRKPATTIETKTAHTKTDTSSSATKDATATTYKPTKHYTIRPLVRITETPTIQETDMTQASTETVSVIDTAGTTVDGPKETISTLAIADETKSTNAGTASTTTLELTSQTDFTPEPADSREGYLPLRDKPQQNHVKINEQTKKETVPLPAGSTSVLAKPTKYHYYPHNQHIYLLPECAIQQHGKMTTLCLMVSTVQSKNNDDHRVTHYPSPVAAVMPACEKLDMHRLIPKRDPQKRINMTGFFAIYMVVATQSGCRNLSPLPRSLFSRVHHVQVCNAVYVRLNYTQPLCACPARYRDPCSASLNADDLHTTRLTTDSKKKYASKAVTLVKTCEAVSEMRECRAPKDWSLLALQNIRTGKSHYLVICKCPENFILEGPMSHDQPTYASVPGIRVYGMMCVRQTTTAYHSGYSANRYTGIQTSTNAYKVDYSQPHQYPSKPVYNRYQAQSYSEPSYYNRRSRSMRFRRSTSEYPPFPWYKVKELAQSLHWI